ncbi:MAG: tyrosine-type recombinase/integrase [Lachnospiraceae bacterium]|jgi:integrase|nr:tyrosine-type recombinase/integrase [Lachnospiraceae bacterium]MCI9661645.1 tyrosine-type recombinase/integrase [Lachnospiraceae bacterium]
MSEKRKDNKGRTLKVGESQRQDLSYQYRYTDLLGKRHCIYSWRLLASDKTPIGKKHGKSLREMEKEVDLMLSQGLNGLGTELTLNDMFEHYIQNKRHRGRNLAENTIRNYRMMYDKNVRDSILGNMKIADIRKINVSCFYEGLQEKGISYGTISFFNKLLSSIFNMALDNDLIRNNPTARSLDVINGTYKRKEALTRKQQEEFLSYLYKQDRDMYRKVTFLIGTMCRVSEFAGITWDEVDMKNKIITIDHQLQHKKFEGDEKAKYRITPTKNTHTRKIPMTDDVYKVLCELHKYYFVLRKDYCVDGKDNFVFFTKSGNLIDTCGFNYELKKAVEQYNATAEYKISTISAHTLRHTGCTRNAEDGMDIKILQYLMGHSNTQITNNIYNHVDEERVVNEVVNMAKRRINRA